MDILELHRRAVEAWQTRVDAIDADAWDNPTPCSDWSVRDLVNHVVYEELWMVPLLEGKTIADVGDQFDGDVLGDDPVASARSASAAALASADELLPQNPTVHLSYADEKASEYATQIAADHVIHGWDLAKGAGQDPTIDPEIVAFLAEWFPHHEELYRSVGIIGPRAEMTGNAQDDLLAAFGRSSGWSAP